MLLDAATLFLMKLRHFSEPDSRQNYFSATPMSPNENRPGPDRHSVTHRRDRNIRNVIQIVCAARTTIIFFSDYTFYACLRVLYTGGGEGEVQAIFRKRV